jgi:hypothetical protein
VTLRQITEIASEAGQHQAIREMDADDMYEAIQMIDDPEFAKNRALKSRIEAVLRRKTDGIILAKMDDNNRQMRYCVILAAISALAGIVGLVVGILK